MDSEGKADQLDALVHQVFKQLQDLASLRRQLDQELGDGFLQMAKARSNMGQKSITCLQYDEREMIPSVKVDCDSGENGLTFDLVQQTLLVEECSKTDDEVRKRVVDKSDQIVTIGGVDETPPPKKDIQAKKIKDPLLMFGVLVPQALRLSKACFQRSVTLVSKICATQAQITGLKAEYQKLHSQVQ